MWIEVPDEPTFNVVNSTIQGLIENEIMEKWADKMFGNGNGGYYMPVPTGLRLAEGIEEVISQFPNFESLPSTSPPGSYQMISITDDIAFDTDDFSSLGVLANGIVVSGVDLLVKSNGNKFIIIVYRDGQVAIVDCSDNSVEIFDSGFFKPWKPIYHEATDSVVFFTSVGLNVFRFSLTTKTLVFSTENGNLTSADENDGIIDRCIGTDGMIYFGSTLSASVWRYDPSNDTFTPFGQVDTITSPTYVYHIGADEDFVYCGLRAGGVYWLSVLNQNTLEKIIIGRGNGHNAMTLTLRNSIEGLYWNINLHGGTGQVNKKYSNGVEVPDRVSTGDMSYEIQEGRLNHIARDPSQWPDNFSFVADIDNLGGLNMTPTILYKENSAENFTTREIDGLTKAELVPSLLKAYDTEVYGVFGAYGPMFVLDTDEITLLREFAQTSVKEIFKFDADHVYISGYANDTREWIVDDEWNNNEHLNPARISVGLSSSYYHQVCGRSGDWLYVFWERSRNDTGSGLSWYNIVTKQIQHSNDMMIASLKNYLVSDMMVAESVLVLVTKPRGSATLPRVFIYDISTEKNLNNITPTTKDLPLVSTAPGIGFLFDGFIVGFSRNIVWKLNISTLDLTIMNMPSSLSISTRGSSCVDVDSGGQIWFLSRPSTETYLYKLDPTTMSAKKKSSNLGLLTYNRIMTITSDNIMYLAGGLSSVAQSDESNDKKFIDKLILTE